MLLKVSPGAHFAMMIVFFYGWFKRYIVKKNIGIVHLITIYKRVNNNNNKKKKPVQDQNSTENMEQNNLETQ